MLRTLEPDQAITLHRLATYYDHMVLALNALSYGITPEIPEELKPSLITYVKTVEHLGDGIKDVADYMTYSAQLVRAVALHAQKILGVDRMSMIDESVLSLIPSSVLAEYRNYAPLADDDPIYTCVPYLILEELLYGSSPVGVVV